MKKTGILFLLLVAFLCSCVQEQKPIYNKYVNKFIGSDPNGCITPVASLPFGMVQIGADTHNGSSGYRYKHTEIIGFSHVHKSGAGCGDFLDILFMPLPVNMNVDSITTLCTQDNFSSFSHEREWAEPGSYSVDLYNGDLNVELTASLRCGLQRYPPSGGACAERYRSEIYPLSAGYTGSRRRRPGCGPPGRRHKMKGTI